MSTSADRAQNVGQACWPHGAPLTRREIRLQRLWEDEGRSLDFLDRWYHRLRITLHLGGFGEVSLGLRYFMRSKSWGGWGGEGGIGAEVWMQSKGWIESQIPGGIVIGAPRQEGPPTPAPEGGERAD